MKRSKLFASARYFDKPKAPLHNTLMITSIVIIIFCGSVLGVSAMVGVDSEKEAQDIIDEAYGSSEEASSSLEEMIETSTTSGYTSEDSNSEVTFNIEEQKLLEVSCTLTWQDEDTIYPAGTNEPDEFMVAIIAPNNEVLSQSSKYLGVPAVDEQRDS